jgi:hypothetical protein
MQGSDEELPEFGVPMLCPMSHTDRLKFVDFLRSAEATSVRAGCRQVIEVLAIVIESVVNRITGRVVVHRVDFRIARSDAPALGGTSAGRICFIKMGTSHARSRPAQDWSRASIRRIRRAGHC